MVNMIWLTNLEVGHMVLQQSLGIADVFFGSNEHKWNHTLITNRGGDEEFSLPFK